MRALGLAVSRSPLTVWPASADGHILHGLAHGPCLACVRGPWRSWVTRVGQQTIRNTNNEQGLCPCTCDGTTRSSLSATASINRTEHRTTCA